MAGKMHARPYLFCNTISLHRIELPYLTRSTSLPCSVESSGSHSSLANLSAVVENKTKIVTSINPGQIVFTLMLVPVSWCAPFLAIELTLYTCNSATKLSGHRCCSDARSLARAIWKALSTSQAAKGMASLTIERSGSRAQASHGSGHNNTSA
jgi:hypothetical protein